jgi:hypothetical protein
MAIESGIKLGVRAGAAPAAAARVTCASRHAAITRELTSYSKYKRWADERRVAWTADRDADSK